MKNRRESTIVSDSGREYTAHKVANQHFTVKDDAGNKSIYGFENTGDIQRHVNKVEKGTTSDLRDFGKNAKSSLQSVVVDCNDDDDDYYDTNESKEDLHDQFESGCGGVMASLTEDGYEYYRG